jgi:hypothetical protein
LKSDGDGHLNAHASRGEGILVPSMFTLPKLPSGTLFEGLMLDSLKLQRRHFDKVVINIEITELFSEETVKRMEHGTVSEIHA